MSNMGELATNLHMKSGRYRGRIVGKDGKFIFFSSDGSTSMRVLGNGGQQLSAGQVEKLNQSQELSGLTLGPVPASPASRKPPLYTLILT